MFSNSGVASCSSFGVVLNTQRRLASTGDTSALVGAMVIIGTLASAAVSMIANEPGVVVGPIRTSILESWISLRIPVTAAVVSEASSTVM